MVPALRCFTGQRLALAIADPLLYATALILLDGHASALFLCPDVLLEDAERLRELAVDWDAIVTDTPDRLPSGLPVPIHAMRDASNLRGGDEAPDLRPVATDWHLGTSGTSGKPKFVKQSLSALTATFKSNQQVDGRVWASMYPLTRFAGLQVVLHSLFLREPLLLGDPGNAAAFARLLVDGGCTALSGTPTMWRRLLMTPEARGIPLKQITIGGEIVDAALLDALKASFPTARLIQVYGAAELGVCFAVYDGLPGFPSSYIPVAPGGRRLHVDESGVLHVSRSGSRDSDSNDLVSVGDVVERVGNRFFFRGRGTGLINVGGMKIHPEEVEQVLLMHPNVRMALAYGRRSSIAGQLVEVDIVIDGGKLNVMLEDIKQHCKSTLPSYMQPVKFNVVEELALNDGMKLARNKQP
jgi:acyl-CoA synthetase (AMP-forming)/AMP-acid ligase II